jgi:FHS family glucose/mannose:H+ symporter-like MFS transporter
LHSIYGLASLIAPLIVGALMQAGAGWKSPLLVVGGLAMLAGLLFLVVDLMGAYKASGVAAPPPEPNSPALEKFDWKPYYVALALGFYVVCEIMVGTRLSQYAQSVLGSSPETGAIITTCFFVGLFSGRVVYIFLKPKISALQQLKLSLLGSFSTLSLGFTMQSWPLVALSALLMAPFYPLSIAFAQELFSKNLNRAMSVVLGISSFCIIVMHLGVGVLTDQFGLQAALWVGPILLCASFLMLMWLPKVFSKVEVR